MAIKPIMYCVPSSSAMLKRLIKSLLLVALFLLAASWFYKVVFLLLLALVWKKNIRSLGLWCYRVVIGVLLVALLWTMPRYRLHTSDRVQLVYQTDDAQPRHAPIHHYLVNVLLPEEGVITLGARAARILRKAPAKISNWILGAAPIAIADWIWEEFDMEVERGNFRKITAPYRQLNASGNFTMSGIYPQVANMLGMKETQAVYVIKPKNYDPAKSYPVVFFMHGLLGNWKLYQGIFKGLEDCIVVSVGTKDWYGIYGERDLNALFEKQIPFLENMGYKVDANNLHLIGLSNGGSASNLACESYSRRFKSITFLSTNMEQTYRISSKVLLIGGKLDHSRGVKDIPAKCRALERRGTRTAKYFSEEGSHFIFAVEQEGILEFLNENIN